MNRKYKNPPIVEVVCGFKFNEETNWDATIPGLLHDKLKENFPRKEQRIIQELEIKQEQGNIQQYLRTTERILFFTEDQKMVIQVGPRLLVINALKPYPNWEKYKEYIKMGLDTLMEITEIKGIENVNLRYINSIKLPRGEDIKEYFRLHISLSEKLLKNLASFIAIVEFSYFDDRDKCRVNFSFSLSRDEYILDIDYFLNQKGNLSISNTYEWLENAHNNIEEIFEEAITDKLRKVFEEVL
jgi:uncharacterized protein (TIGR04255 family)